MLTEFEFIQKLALKYGLNKIGDDCAVLPKDAETDLLITADMLVEDVDFRLEWTRPELLGHKALAVSLSDIAAMGGDPSWAMLSIGIPENVWNTDFTDRFYKGFMHLAAEHDVELVGGDVSKTPDNIVIDSIVGGESPKGKAVLRSGAKPGDAIFVTGTLGGATGGLNLLEHGVSLNESSSKSTREILLRQLQPKAQLNIVKPLIKQGIVTAMIDVSDGLSSDLHHLCTASGVGARIYKPLLPKDLFLNEFFTDQESMLMALNGGEDFELLFTGNSEKISEAKIAGVTHIGTVTASTDIIEFIDGDGTEILEPKGYRHF